MLQKFAGYLGTWETIALFKIRQAGTVRQVSTCAKQRMKKKPKSYLNFISGTTFYNQNKPNQ
jgi:hypothetical protein